MISKQNEAMITSRRDLKIGMLVNIITSEGINSRGYITEFITKNNSKKGIQVKIKNGTIGRVESIVDRDDLKSEQFRFLNEFLYLKDIYSIWDNENRRYIVLHSKNEDVGVLFSTKAEAIKFIEDKKLKDKFGKITVNKINKRRLIVENFKTLDIKHFIIDRKMKISINDLKEKEIHFNNLLK